MVFDALDECDEDNRARLDFLKDIRSLQPTVRTFATSRPIRSIEQDCQGAPQVKIHPQNADIDEFVQGRLESEPNCMHVRQRMLDLCNSSWMLCSKNVKGCQYEPPLSIYSGHLTVLGFF